MDLMIVGFIIFTLITLIFGVYIKIFFIDLSERNDYEFYVDDWDSFDIAVHYLSYVLHKYMKNNSDGYTSTPKDKIPASVTEQWTSVWFQAKARLIRIEESYKKDLEALIISMKSKAIDIGLFKYNSNQVKTEAQSYLDY